MEFFNKKEEVIDVKLTQYGKNLLSRGAFKPVYYMFFDDDILYDASKGGFTEHQNETEARILENTPKLKTQHLTLGVEEAYIMKVEDSPIFSYMFNQQAVIAQQFPLQDIYEEGISSEESFDREMSTLYAEQMMRSQFAQFSDNRFVTLKRRCDHDVQEKILLYPLYKQEVQNPNAPRYDLLTLDAKFKNNVHYQHFTASGIIKNVPQLTIDPNYKLILDNTAATPGPSREDILATLDFFGGDSQLAQGNAHSDYRLSLLENSGPDVDYGEQQQSSGRLAINTNVDLLAGGRSRQSRNQSSNIATSDSEGFVDVTSDELILDNNSKLKLEKNSIVLDIEEVNSYFGSDNFTLQIFEIKTREDQTNHLREIDDINQIRNLFHIKTDKSVKFEGAEYKTRRQRNNKNRSDL